MNDTTIVPARLDLVDYYHVELDAHDVLIAEGAPSESFLDDDSRNVFHNAHEFAALYPRTAAPGAFCAPRIEDGPRLEAIRARLAGLAQAASIRAASAWRLAGTRGAGDVVAGRIQPSSGDPRGAVALVRHAATRRARIDHANPI